MHILLIGADGLILSELRALLAAGLPMTTAQRVRTLAQALDALHAQADRLVVCTLFYHAGPDTEALDTLLDLIQQTLMPVVWITPPRSAQVRREVTQLGAGYLAIGDELTPEALAQEITNQLYIAAERERLVKTLARQSTRPPLSRQPWEGANRALTQLAQDSGETPMPTKSTAGLLGILWSSVHHLTQTVHSGQLHHQESGAALEQCVALLAQRVADLEKRLAEQKTYANAVSVAERTGFWQLRTALFVALCGLLGVVMTALAPAFLAWWRTP